MTEYIKLFWQDAPEGEPPVILYEVDLDNERLTLRSIDIFADRSAENIEDFYADVLEITPTPTVEELNGNTWGGEIRACLMDQAEFEMIWDSHFYGGALQSLNS